MTRNEILDQVTDMIREEFENDELNISFETVAQDVDGWDSLTHLSLLHEIEKEFAIKFSMAEIQGLKNVGELVKTIEKHMDV